MLSRVLTGARFTVGSPEMLEAPDDQACVVDKQHDPSIFVTFQDAQAYPEYFVQFKSGDADGGSGRGGGFSFGANPFASAFGSVSRVPNGSGSFGFGLPAAAANAPAFGSPSTPVFGVAPNGTAQQPQWHTTVAPPAHTQTWRPPRWESQQRWLVLGCSVRSVRYPANDAFGDDASTHWLAERPSGTVPGEWLAFDTGSELGVDAVQLISGGADEAHHVTEFQLAYSKTQPRGSTCEAAWHEAARVVCGGKETTSPPFPKIKARYWRVLLVGTRGNETKHYPAIARIALRIHM